MFAGHFGLAAAVKAKAPEVPVWALIVGSQLLDVAFAPLWLAGIETMEQLEDGGYGEAIFHADYTHSLLGALILSMLAAILYARLWGRRAGYVGGMLVFSHWILDLVVHRADMPILPGNIGDFPLLGFGVWQYKGIAIGIETLLVAIGLTVYVAVTLKRTKDKNRKSAWLSSAAVALLLVMSLLPSIIELL